CYGGAGGVGVELPPQVHEPGGGVRGSPSLVLICTKAGPSRRGDDDRFRDRENSEPTAGYLKLRHPARYGAYQALAPVPAQADCRRTGLAGATTGGSTRSSGSSYRRRVSSIKRPTLGACQPTRPPTKSEEIVEKAAGCGLTHDKICPFIVLERTG